MTLLTKLTSLTYSRKPNLIRMLSSQKYLTGRQELFNNTVGILPGSEKIEKKNCQKTIVLESVREHLEKAKYVQLEGLCLFEVISIIDDYTKNPHHFFNSSLGRGLTSRTKGQQRISYDDKLDKFFKIHERKKFNSITGQSGLNIKEFIISYVKHDIFTNIYCSAYRLQMHFETSRLPVYSFCQWGDSEDKKGYNEHAVLVYGIDENQQVHYYDVSDKLNTNKFSRFRTMCIDDYNKKREFATESAYGRSYIFYGKGA